MTRKERVTLVGGPGDGERHEIASGDEAVSWIPHTDVERVAMRTMGHQLSGEDPVTYVRSRRTKHLFVYQP